MTTGHNRRRQGANSNAEGGDSQNFSVREVIPSEDIPSLEEAILSEEEHDGQMYTQAAKIVMDLHDKNHVFNQTYSHKLIHSFDILGDNQ